MVRRPSSTCMARTTNLTLAPTGGRLSGTSAPPRPAPNVGVPNDPPLSASPLVCAGRFVLGDSLPGKFFRVAILVESE
eukprot:scaffold135364_cov31-Tisochrysis_lutea.AAC.2